MIGVLGETIELSGKGFENTRDLLGDLLGAKKSGRYTKGAWQVPKWLAFVASQVVFLGETW
jgi:hypothetical protein